MKGVTRYGTPSGLLLAGIFLAVVTACVPYDIKPVATADSQKAAAECRKLYEDPSLKSLDGRIIYQPEGSSLIPSKAMVSDATFPDETQKKAVRKWEEITRQCLKMLQAAGHVTSATQDIIEKRRSDLRYGLYTGELSFGAYNMGIVQTEIDLAGIQRQEAETYQRGSEIGAQRAQQFYSEIRRQSEMNALRSQLNSYSYGRKTYWNCNASHVGADTYYVSCY